MLRVGAAPRAAVAHNMTSATSSPEAPGLSASAGRSARAGSPRERLQKLLSVPGYEPSRVNDLLLLRPAADHRAAAGPEQEEEGGRNRHVVFFHGDIQNFEEEMSLRPEGAQWLSWSLERVALALGRRFPDRHVWVVRAGRMHLHMFSSYLNFVESNMFGAPEHSAYSSGSGAFLQLRALLSHGMERAGPPTPPRLQGGLPSGFSLAVVGFSKGCVVLNQMVHELAGARGDPRLRRFVDAVSDMYWLDGGHPGGSGTWVTDAPLLQELAASGVSLHAHVTPYEVRDPARAWVGREHGRFIGALEEFGARLTKKLHFEDEPPSIENHFRVIQEF